MLKIRDNLFSSSPWDIHEVRYEPDQEVNTGSIFMTGNGYLGYRGTFPEDTETQKAGCFLSDTYDNADGTWAELVNAPNALRLDISCNGIPLPLKSDGWNNYRRGIYFRLGEWYAQVSNDQLSVSTRRFASYADIHGLLSRTEITASSAVSLEITTGIDGRVWNLNGCHFRGFSCVKEQSYLAARVETVQSGIEVQVIETSRLVKIDLQGEKHELTEVSFTRVRTNDSGYIFRKHKISLDEGESLVVESFSAVYSSNDVEKHLLRPSAVTTLNTLRDEGYEMHRQRHAACWEELWRDVDISLEGDERSALMLRYNLYHAVICVPIHTDHLPIGARGLSCQAYQGAAFWDQEMFNMPMFLHTRPSAARNILMYRYRTLGGARRKAEKLGYRGAFYPWISADTGDEICPSYFFRDVLTGRKIRNHFNDWQIHISPDISYAVRKYVETTGDTQFLADYGAEMIFEIARFLYSRVHLNLERDDVEIIRVLGPDEYHENVDNNFYTNSISREACAYAWEVFCWMKCSVPEKLDSLAQRIALNEDEPKQWEMLSRKIRTQEFSREDPVIEQFDGYFSLEDITPEELKERLIDPQEYWGWPNGIAVETQVIKQADVLQLLMLYPDLADEPTLSANWEYYAQRTQHGSSLSPSVYSVTGARAGHIEEAYKYFLTSCSIDLCNTNKAVSGGTFIGGIHTAACAAAWQMAVFGFAGLRISEHGYRFDPRLPEAWRSMKFSLCRWDQRISVTITGNECTVSAPLENTQAVEVYLGTRKAEIPPGEKLRLWRE